MATSFEFLKSVGSENTTRTRPVLVTGAAGRIGQPFSEYARDRYKLRLLVHSPENISKVENYGETIQGEINDLEFMKQACQGIDTVVHLAANPSPEADWDSLLPVNIDGTYNVFMAARAAGCRKVIFASSIHAISGYHTEYQVHPEEAVNPGDLYGVSKCFGEALGRYMATQKQLSCIAIRIGWFASHNEAAEEKNMGMLNAFISHRDLCQLICRSIDDEKLLFAIFHGLSYNRFNRMDIKTAEELVGYSPEDDFTKLNRKLEDLHLRREVRPHNETRD